MMRPLDREISCPDLPAGSGLGLQVRKGLGDRLCRASELRTVTGAVPDVITDDGATQAAPFLDGLSGLAEEKGSSKAEGEVRG
ncbi:hypothetical protein SKAU_G00346290 [Synaphobranchus kaupii]|uniref:Uncharacterized protein n=1 Tax=Synaphobranchus kaupii TaxID=118154 RepID=A0A9Q1EJJ0_SYNKA|nr:hypothetical protein SKAU_G00346290 [Synaphobranchus kaupii]